MFSFCRWSVLPFLEGQGNKLSCFRRRSIVVLLTDWKLDEEWKSTIQSNPPRFAHRVIPYCTFPCCSSGSPQACKKGSSSVRRSQDGCTAARGAHTEPRWSVSKVGYAWDFCRMRRDSLMEAQKTARATNNFSYYSVLLVDQIRSKTYCMFYIRGHFIEQMQRDLSRIERSCEIFSAVLAIKWFTRKLCKTLTCKYRISRGPFLPLSLTSLEFTCICYSCYFCEICKCLTKFSSVPNFFLRAFLTFILYNYKLLLNSLFLVLIRYLFKCFLYPIKILFTFAIFAKIVDF